MQASKRTKITDERIRAIARAPSIRFGKLRERLGVNAAWLRRKLAEMGIRL